MPPPETVFCAQQIQIPPELPDILKAFTKAAIRTQPKDVLQWSVAYFTDLSKGDTLPVKDRFEMIDSEQNAGDGLTPGLLNTLHKQLSSRETVTVEELQTKWTGLCLPEDQLETLLSLGSFDSDINWMDFFALGCSAIRGTLLSSLSVACEILTEDEEGAAARIPFETFSRLYTYLAGLDEDFPPEEISNFLDNLQPQAEVQEGMIKPLDFIHLEDPPPSSSTEDPSPSSSTEDPPPSSSTEDPPPSSSTEDPPPSSSTEDPPPSSSTEDPPPSSSTEDPPPSSSTEDPPPSSSTEDPTSTTNDE